MRGIKNYFIDKISMLMIESKLYYRVYYFENIEVLFGYKIILKLFEIHTAIFIENIQKFFECKILPKIFGFFINNFFLYLSCKHLYFEDYFSKFCYQHSN